MIQNMMQRMIYVALALAAAMSVSCQQGELLEPSAPVRDGYVALHFNTDITDMEEVSTRAVDPDGGGVQDMTLFCFDKYGLFITAVTATIDVKRGVSEGSFTADVPENTRTVHFVANQVMSTFPQDYFRGKSESEVMALLEGSSGRMIYWARFASVAADSRNIAEQMKNAGGRITMLRNHAKVSVMHPADNGYFTVKGFAVYNTNAFGTVAPYHPEKGFDFNADDWKNDNFVTLPANGAKLSDVTDVTSSMGTYVFESENTTDDPVSVILYGRNAGDSKDLYYRVMLMQNSEQIPIRRNHDYQINIKGSLSFGQETFAQAVEAAATNNIWISISDKVNEVEDRNYILTVANTFYVLGADKAGHPYTLTYTVKGKNGTQITVNDKPEVTWTDNLVANYSVVNKFDIVDGEGHGEITISLLPMGNNEKLEGTLLVKKGHLQRKIKVITVKEQSFAPSWVGTEIYGGMDPSDPTKNRTHVTVMFTVPETCPAELFPLKAYVSVAGLDIRPESGMALTVVRNGDNDWYSSGDITPEPDYKYLYVIDKPGVQRVYFENILSQQDGYTGNLHIEAEHFQTMNRTFTYSNSRKSITVEGLKAYNVNKVGDSQYAKDEYVLYRLVPQKINASVQFDLQLRDKVGDGISGDLQGTPFNAEEKDEFMLYSRYLDFYSDKEVGQVGVDRFDCIFYTDASTAWWQRNNPQGGRMLMFKPRAEIAGNPPKGTGKYSIYLKSNRPESAEVIRIASNRVGIEAVLEEDADTDGNYAGNAYRSVTFELANYNPFRFGARLNYNAKGWVGKEPDRLTDPTADIQELVTPLEWDYEPGKNVEIAFDVTSFNGSDGKSVNPFGTEFEVFIDAPMLTLDGVVNTGLEGKLYEVSPGRFAYKVNADREKERGYGSTEGVVNKDTTEVNQSGERKVLNFKVKDVVSAGDIVISSDNSKVVFYSKTFRVTNNSMKGKIQYQPQDGSPILDIEKDAFVAFERVVDGSRIGAVNITSAGNYELRLRKEYTFNWHTDKVQFHYEKGDVVYYKVYDSLSELFKSSDTVVLNADNLQ